MFETLEGFDACADYEPHSPHAWRSGFLWLRKHSCRGIKEHLCTYDCGNPCGAKLYFGKTINQLRADAGLPPYEEPHRHFFKLAKVLITSADFIADVDAIYWECSCGKIEFIDRLDLRSQMMPEHKHRWYLTSWSMMPQTHQWMCRDPDCNYFTWVGKKLWTEQFVGNNWPQ